MLWEEFERCAALHPRGVLTHLGLIFISNVRLVKKKRGIEIKNWSFPNNWKWPEINYCFYIRVISQTLFFAFVFIDANSQQRYALKKTTHHVFPFILHPAVLINNNATNRAQNTVYYDTISPQFFPFVAYPPLRRNNLGKNSSISLESAKNHLTFASSKHS